MTPLRTEIEAILANDANLNQREYEDRLIRIIRAAMGLRDALEKFDAIHFTESGQSCAWGSDVAYEAIEAFEKAVRGK